MDEDHRQLVVDTMARSPWHLQTLRAVRDLGLPDWAIGAGFVRNAVWDRLHGFRVLTALADVDVLFFDATEISRGWEKDLEARLTEQLPDRPWSVRNQARMHVRNIDCAYGSTEDAMSFWLETPTCVAARLDDGDELSIVAPFGLADLITLRGRPTAAGQAKADQYLTRMKAKNWPAIWPQVLVEGLELP